MAIIGRKLVKLDWQIIADKTNERLLSDFLEAKTMEPDMMTAKDDIWYSKLCSAGAPDEEASIIEDERRSLLGSSRSCMERIEHFSERIAIKSDCTSCFNSE